MKNAAENRPRNIVKGNIFDALRFSASKATALKIKAYILSALLEHIRAAGYTQAQLVTLLDEHQPSISNLLHGRIAQVSIEKLLRYADRLGLQATLTIASSQLRPQERTNRKPTTTRRRASRATLTA